MKTLKIKNVRDFKNVEISINKYNFITFEKFEHKLMLSNIINLCQEFKEDNSRYLIKKLNLDYVITSESEIEFTTETYKLLIKNKQFKVDGILKNSTDIFDNKFEHLFPTEHRIVINKVINGYKNKDESIIVLTNSPYAVNQVNLLIAAYDVNNTQYTDGASINFDELNVLHINDKGEFRVLKCVDKRFIDVMQLSDDINTIYETYKILKGFYE